MLVLVSYDVSTVDKQGRARLRKVAKACSDFGQRVQNSVFECLVDPAQWASLKQQLLNIFNDEEDSLRFYFLGSNWHRRVEHHGTRKPTNLEGPLVV
jgi:CRISPR-associated protein Cas2